MTMSDEQAKALEKEVGYRVLMVPPDQKCSRCDEKNRTLVPIPVFEENKDTDVWFLCPHCFRTRILGRS
jgi:hypothetical protein